MEAVETPDAIVVHEVSCCANCEELARQVEPVRQAVKEHLTYKTEVAGFGGARVEGKLSGIPQSRCCAAPAGGQTTDVAVLDRTANVALSDLCRMYLWRFAIEHMFRFLKQHMGLDSNRSPDLVSAQQWMWLCALAYWRLLLLRDVVKEDYPAWHSHSRSQPPKHQTRWKRQRQTKALLPDTPARLIQWRLRAKR